MRTWTHDQIQLLNLAAKDLREAQKDPRNEQGSRVMAMIAGLDQALANVSRDAEGDAYPHPALAHELVTACFALRSAQHTYMLTTTFDRAAMETMSARVGLMTENLDEALDEIRQAEEIGRPSM